MPRSSCCLQFWFANSLCTWVTQINYWELIKSSARTRLPLTMHANVVVLGSKALAFASFSFSLLHLGSETPQAVSRFQLHCCIKWSHGVKEKCHRPHALTLIWDLKKKVFIPHFTCWILTVHLKKCNSCFTASLFGFSQIPLLCTVCKKNNDHSILYLSSYDLIKTQHLKQ